MEFAFFYLPIVITIYPTVKNFILFHGENSRFFYFSSERSEREKLYFESFRGEIKDLLQWDTQFY